MNKRISWGISILKNPEKEFSALPKKELDQVIANYLVLLLYSGFIAGIFSFFFSLGRAIYFDTILRAETEYGGVLNYSIGIAISIFFFYIFAGTVIFFCLSLIIKRIYNKPYVEILKMMAYSSVPLLFFGWVPGAAIPLLIWAIFLFVANR